MPVIRSNQVLRKHKRGQTKSNEQNLTWTDYDTSSIFAEVLFDPQYRGRDYTVGWATIMERLAPKKSSNKRKHIQSDPRSSEEGI